MTYLSRTRRKLTMQAIDLHTHSTYSDGTLSPTELVERAKEKGLCALAIADHDTIGGFMDGEQAALAAGIEFVPACEFSAYLGDLQVHMLGYYIDPTSEMLVDKLTELITIREERNHDMQQALARLGINISNEQLREAAGHDIITRLHFAKVLMSIGCVESIQEAFDKYVSPGGLAYVPHKALTAKECIELIKNAGGVPVLSHPFLYKLDDSQIEDTIQTLVDYGLMGIEAIYSSHTAQQTELAKFWADKYNLVVTGGSDFHGANRPAVDVGIGRGNLFVPYSLLEGLKQARDIVRSQV